MPDMINEAADNIHASFDRAHDRLHRPLTPKDRLRKAGPRHRHHKHVWDFTTMGASCLVRHARRRANLGERGPAFTLDALAVPMGAVALTGVGFLARVAVATLQWTWYYGYDNAQGDDSLRKDLVQFELQEAVAELQVVATYADEHAAHKAALQPFWQQARLWVDDFTADLDTFEPKIGGSTRLRKKLRHYEHLLDAHAP